MKNERISVVITGGYKWSYYEWFLLGFYKLQESGRIKLKFKVPFFSKLLTYPNTEFGYRVLEHFRCRTETDTYNMTGYVQFPDGTKKTFTIDCADAPYSFDAKLLNQVDIYFKMQYPCEIESDSFHLTPDVEIPWLDTEHVDENGKELESTGKRKLITNFAAYRKKIYPLMVGPRRLSKGLSRYALLRGYRNYISDRQIDKSKKMMCYFGNALGPKPNAVDVPDFLWESDLVGYFKNRISHPNEKRAAAADLIAGLEDCDARIISRAHSDSGIGIDESLIIPLPDFCAHIAKFQYNFNISGYRKSIPNRFIESFMVGTAIMTDKLSVKWYLPFDAEEVVETVEMGYLPMEEVDWEQFQEDLKNLPKADSECVVRNFEEKWSPEVVANYILDTIEKN